MEKLRRVEVNGHQEYWLGWFHQFTSDGLAIIEMGDGSLRAENIYKIKFVVPHGVLHGDSITPPTQTNEIKE